jgi:hypothetical protein
VTRVDREAVLAPSLIREDVKETRWRFNHRATRLTYEVTVHL